jgi:hypothetical protein
LERHRHIPRGCLALFVSQCTSVSLLLMAFTIGCCSSKSATTHAPVTPVSTESPVTDAKTADWSSRPWHFDIRNNETNQAAALAAYVYVSGVRRDDPDYPRLIFAVWRDGYIVWSHDQRTGGPPYFEAKLNSGETGLTIDKLVDQVSNIEITNGMNRSSPDYVTSYLLLRSNEGRLFQLAMINDEKLSIQDHARGRDGAWMSSGRTSPNFERAWRSLCESGLRLIPSKGRKLEKSSFQFWRP